MSEAATEDAGDTVIDPVIDPASAAAAASVPAAAPTAPTAPEAPPAAAAVDATAASDAAPMPTADATTGPERPSVFRLPRTAYLIVLFFLFGAMPVAFTSGGLGHDSNGGLVGSQASVGWPTLVLIVPVLVTVFIARWATFVDGTGIRVRAVFGSQLLRWDEIRGLAVEGRTVYAVVDGGGVRLPCVHVSQLGQLARASAGRLPKIRDPKLKAAPSRRRR